MRRTNQELLERTIEIAVHAGEIILAHYEDHLVGGAKIYEKEDRSPLTEADLEANRHIMSALKSLTPDVPAISEEEAPPPYESRKNWSIFWLVDPLDGTKEFLKRNGEFTVNIALVNGGTPEIGVIYAPAKRLLYYARSGGGAWKKEGTAPAQRIYSELASRSKPLVVVESRSHALGGASQYLAPCVIKEVVSIGSSLKFCWVAEGRADVYLRMVPTMEWDVAAGDCIYRNSARIGSHPSELVYNKPDLRNDGFLIGLAEP